MTYEKILNRMLAAVPADVDKREGSILYDAVAPAAVELAQMYIELDVVLNETFADTASREYLVRRASERGVSPYSATYAAVKGVFNVEVPLDSRFSLEGYHYKVAELLDASEHSYKLVCETAGSGPNCVVGRLVPVAWIEGLKTAQLTEVLVPGEDDEDTEVFRKRYLASLDSQAFGGNIVDYKNRVNALDGVGGVKVYPVWNGGGTVKLVLVDSLYAKPSQALISQVQTAVDPTQNQGQGVGIAPIGHVVTVVGATETTIDLTFSLTYQSGWSWSDVEGYVKDTVDAYFKELNQTWADQSQLIVRISQLESRLLGLEGIVDVENTKLNNQASNLTLGADCIAKRGEIHV